MTVLSMGLGIRRTVPSESRLLEPRIAGPGMHMGSIWGAAELRF